MTNGLSISEKEFLVMPQKEQNLILFKNIQEIKKAIDGYRFYYKLTATIGGVLTLGMSYIFSKITGL